MKMTIEGRYAVQDVIISKTNMETVVSETPDIIMLRKLLLPCRKPLQVSFLYSSKNFGSSFMPHITYVVYHFRMLPHTRFPTNSVVKQTQKKGGSADAELQQPIKPKEMSSAPLTTAHKDAFLLQNAIFKQVLI